MTSLTIRRAMPDDIAFIMATERMPGYEVFVGRSSRQEHEAALANPAYAYLIAEDDSGRAGFVILRDLTDPSGNTCLKRIAVASTEKGTGSAMLKAAIDWVFDETATHRLWLDVIAYNARAQHVYRKFGFREEGLMREAYRLPDGQRVDLKLMSVLRPDRAAKL